MNREQVSASFDQAFAALYELRQLLTDSDDVRFNRAVEALEVARFRAIIACIGYAAPESILVKNLIAESQGDYFFIHILRKLVKSLRILSPGDIDPDKGAELIVNLLASTPLGIAPDAAAELAMIRYCKLNDIDECGPLGVYIELIVRECLGMTPELPPSSAEVQCSISNGVKTLAFLRKNQYGAKRQAVDTTRAA